MTTETVATDHSFTTKSYDMNVYLKENFKNQCKLVVTCENSESSLVLKLDKSSFDIDSVKINGKQVDYSVNKCLISLNSDFLKGKDYTVEMNYHGRVNYADRMGERSVFVDNKCSYLPEVYDWYPMLQNGKKDLINFNIKFNTQNRLVTNLSKQVLISTDGYVTVSGSKNYIYVSTGYYTSLQVDGINVICSEDRAISNDILSYVKDTNNSKISGKYYSFDKFYEDDRSTDRPFNEIAKEGGIVLLPMHIGGSGYIYSFDNTVLISD